jgi:hypothetical protein
MMGADGPRTYLIGFQNSAEARGTGGLLGGFGVMQFDNGKPTIETLASNVEIEEASADIDLGPEFNAQYGFTKPYSDIRNSNLSSHFPYAAQIWKAMWEQQSGRSVDGVIVTDPVALSYLLGAVGPITMPDGEIITQDNVVELTLSTAYVRFPSLGNREKERKEYLQTIAAEVAKKLTEPVKSPRQLLDAFGRVASERRVAVWSASPTEQKLLEETPLAFAISGDAAPRAEVVINNLAGNKMDYYLVREIEYVADGCNGETRNSTVTVQLANTADPDKLPPRYVAGASSFSPDLEPTLKLDVPRGTMISSVRLIATKGAKLVNVTSAGKPVPAFTHQELGHPSFEVQVVIPAGQSGELVFQLTEPTSPGAPRVPVQPLIDKVAPSISVPTC